LARADEHSCGRGRTYNFVKDTLEAKLAHYEKLIDEYNIDRYPQKGSSRHCPRPVSDILFRKRKHRTSYSLECKADDLRDSSEDMEDVETFFKSQRTIFDSARQLQRDLQNELDICQDADATKR
jgi:hypothetical protein